MSAYFTKLLFDSLDRRMRPEDVARIVGNTLPLSQDEKQVLKQAARHAGGWSSMTSDFARPSTMASQLSTAAALFATSADVDPTDMEAIQSYLTQAEKEIAKEFGKNNFKADRLSRAGRAAVGLDISKRQYNKRFRLATRMESKRLRVLREALKRSLALASKSRLAARLKIEDLTDANTACFIAYYVARCNLRSTFTNTSQVRPYDEICEMLMRRCKSSPTTNWEAIAHVLPDPDILDRISHESRGRLLGEYFELLRSAAQLLKETWAMSNINRETMVVRRGNDSSTWNITAGAWNKLRSGWFALLYSLGLQDWIDAMCPGKVLRLMAADVAAWHRLSGGDLHKDTGPWCDLPLPWEVLEGKPCPKTEVERICAKWNVDPVKGGWSAPPPERNIARFTPTPELVHGVTVGSPALAALLRSTGVFSGKPQSMKLGDNMLG